MQNSLDLDELFRLCSAKPIDGDSFVCKSKDTLFSVTGLDSFDRVFACIPKPLCPSGGILVSKQISNDRSKTNTARKDSWTDNCMGSPLEIESCVDYENVERQLAQAQSRRRGTYHPLPSKMARDFLSRFMLSQAKVNKSILCLCNPADNKEKTIAVGYTTTNSNKKCLLNMQYFELNRSDGKARFNQLMREYRMNYSTHADYIPTKASAHYCIIPVASGGFVDDSSALTNTTSISVYVEWSNIDGLLTNPPPDSVANLKFKLVCGDKSSIVYSLYEELLYIKAVATGLSTGKIEWPEVERSTTPLQLITKLLSLQSYESEDPAADDACHVTGFDQRKNLDFSDRLWPILRACQSFSELKEVFECITESVSKKRCKPLMVFASNTNSLAKWIYNEQSNMASTSTSFEMGPMQAILMFLEIGLEKLTKDCIHAFLGCFSGLVTLDKLDGFVKTSSIPTKLTNLTKLHTVLELCALMHGYLRLPLVTVRSATASALQFLSLNDAFPADGFPLSIPVANISGLLSLQSPEKWEATFGVDGNVTTVNITKSECMQSIDLNDVEPSTDENTFYCTVLKCIDIQQVF